MNEVAKYDGDRKMTVKELSTAIDVPERTIHNAIDRLFPGLKKNGMTTMLDEEQISAISKELKRAHNSELASSGKVVETDLEMMEKAADVMRWLYGKVEEERNARIEAERRNAVLMHVSKTYTATEIAKEMGMRSAQELNKFLADHKVQYFHNDTWVPYADYASLGYFEIKQEILDNGKVVYHRRITQDGRAFILNLKE